MLDLGNPKAVPEQYIKDQKGHAGDQKIATADGEEKLPVIRPVHDSKYTKAPLELQVLPTGLFMW